MSGLGAFDSVVRQCLWTDVLLETITWDIRLGLREAEWRRRQAGAEAGARTAQAGSRSSEAGEMTGRGRPGRKTVWRWEG
ncbi:hypothetical protein EYF80_034222 [Liparis tanakae]|uniref:Uncharacterized protein n=1 Tax=Liparis tanakae TaxID=230148 RepID=A0A4Z2GSH2_9TELE|nr:hypothetical protein EYF80_034222 [Liparis tanakae]